MAKKAARAKAETAETADGATGGGPKRPGRPNYPAGTARVPWFKFRLSEAEAALIKAGAEAAGVTASELARSATLEAAEAALQKAKNTKKGTGR